MLHVIRCMQDEQGNLIPDELRSFHRARWLKYFDVDAYDGCGLVEWTNDLGQARKFSEVYEAAQFYRLQAKVRPLRDDGEPNRPLTGHTSSLETFDASELREPIGMRKWWRRLCSQ
jgi:hypothetical protein